MERDTSSRAGPATQRDPTASGSPSPASEVRRLARQTFGTDEKADRWLRRPTTALAGRTPLDVTRSGTSGERQVIDLLKRIDHGLSA